MAVLRGPKDRNNAIADNSTVNLQTAQTGNADSTNTADRGHLRRTLLPSLLNTARNNLRFADRDA